MDDEYLGGNPDAQNKYWVDSTMHFPIQFIRADRKSGEQSALAWRGERGEGGERGDGERVERGQGGKRGGEVRDGREGREGREG